MKLHALKDHMVLNLMLNLRVLCVFKVMNQDIYSFFLFIFL